ncbi:hypothetical protein C2G38_2137826 [Gigaspora rosea]|uniref:Attractin/MKLN-like beta-propeller domain-containing protein n=1 Tax=Gigaspora rosea TaxID=44941 RepID=A0A397VXX9_9GLOM|nr:hypothetical protein C2G38_2137826 [Gigaspora rosea]
MIFFYIDCSMSFSSSIDSIPYTSLSNLSGIPSIDVAGSSVVGPYNDIILTFGGSYGGSYGYQLIYTFDTKNSTWNSLTTYGILPPIRKGVRPVFSYGRLYAFGGFNNFNGAYYNSLDMLDFRFFNWTNITLSNAPSGRDGYVSALLSDGNILYLGGYVSGKTVGLDIVYLYDTNNNLWQNMSTAGTTPESRGYFTSVLNLKKNRLIIYGGESNRVYYHAAVPTLAVLDLSSNPFTWISQKVSGNFIPPHLLLHTANVVHNYMILAYAAVVSTAILIYGLSAFYKWYKVTGFSNKFVATP